MESSRDYLIRLSKLINAAKRTETRTSARCKPFRLLRPGDWQIWHFLLQSLRCGITGRQRLHIDLFGPRGTRSLTAAESAWRLTIPVSPATSPRATMLAVMRRPVASSAICEMGTAIARWLGMRLTLVESTTISHRP